MLRLYDSYSKSRMLTQRESDRCGRPRSAQLQQCFMPQSMTMPKVTRRSNDCAISPVSFFVSIASPAVPTEYQRGHANRFRSLTMPSEALAVDDEGYHLSLKFERKLHSQIMARE